MVVIDLQKRTGVIFETKEYELSRALKLPTRNGGEVLIPAGTKFPLVKKVAHPTPT